MTTQEILFPKRDYSFIEETINYLLAHACPPIQYRLRRELLKQPPSSGEMLALQSQILEDRAVKEVLSWQQPDGWIAWNFHGSHSMEAGIRLLCEKGLVASHPALAKALLTLGKETGRLARGLGKVGAILDDLGLGGAQLMRTALLTQAGVEDEPHVQACTQACIQEQINLALANFKDILTITTLDDLVEAYKGKLVFRPGVQWPSIYHLRLLAWTYSWRSAKNREMIAACIQRLVRFSPMPDIKVRYKSQLIAPASFGMHDFNVNLNTLDDRDWMMWFHRMELLARLGVVRQVPELEAQAAALDEFLQAGRGKFTKKLNHAYFRKWGAYTGLMLETDWRDPQRRMNDLTFRALLIRHYSISRQY
jgi:hypothetical protein